MDFRQRIDVLSDSTGATAERVVRAALLQFPQSNVEIRRHPRVRTKQRAEPILRGAAADGSLLVFSVVSPELGDYIHQMTSELHIAAIDVIGSVIGKFETYFAQPPVNRPGTLLPLSEEYFRRIEAVDFTVKADAGRDPQRLLEADLVLVGVSRTSKTPVATLLAQRGLKVANFTVVVGRQLPVELDDVAAERVVAMTIDAQTLCAIRQERLERLGMSTGAAYGLREHVERELEYANDLFEKRAWRVVDTTASSVDETAEVVLELVGRR